MVVFFVVKGENCDCNDMTILIVSKEERERRVKKRGPHHLLNSYQLYLLVYNFYFPTKIKKIKKMNQFYNYLQLELINTRGMHWHVGEEDSSDISFSLFLYYYCCVYIINARTYIVFYRYLSVCLCVCFEENI